MFAKKLTLAIAAMAVGFSSMTFAGDIRIATGSEGGGYEGVGKRIAMTTSQEKGHDFDFEILNTAGSGENITLFNDEDAEVIIVQADALNVNRPSIPFKAKNNAPEYVFWIYNKALEIDDIEEIEGNKDLGMVLIEDSGAVTTMQSFVLEDDGYKVNLDTAIYAYDLYEAVSYVADGVYDGRKVAGMLYVGSKIPAEIVKDFGNKVAIGEATDGDFDDAKDVNGNKLYKDCEIKDVAIRGLETSTWGKPSTVCVDSMIVYNTTIFEDKKEERALLKGIIKATR